jgi:outer membrane immunogenic protein
VKRILVIGATLAALIVTPVLAADMAAPVLKAPATPAWSWTGFYVGLNAGGGFGRSNVDDMDCYWCDSTHVTNAFGVAGGQLGYNLQFRSVVLGVEGDFDWAGYHQSYSLCVTCASFATGTVKMDDIGTARARLGLAYDNALIYVTAGGAWGGWRFDQNAINNGTPPGPPGSVRAVWTDHSEHAGIVGGAGLEWKVDQNWSLRGEWLHVELAQKNVFGLAGVGAPGNGNCCRFGTSGSFDIARLGVNYSLTH